MNFEPFPIPNSVHSFDGAVVEDVGEGVEAGDFFRQRGFGVGEGFLYREGDFGDGLGVLDGENHQLGDTGAGGGQGAEHAFQAGPLPSRIIS